MKGKKTELIGFRLSQEEKETAEEVCSGLGQTPGSIAGILFEQFIKQRTQRGNRLVWPPEFNYYPSASKNVQEKVNSKKIK